MHRDVQRQKDRLDVLFSKAAAINDFELKGHWAEYLCVRASGFVEHAVRTTLMAYADDRASPEVARFVRWHLERFTNPKTEKVIPLVQRFSPAWGRKVEAFLKENPDVQAAVNSLVGHRHRIAHGRNTTLSYAQVKSFYDASLRLVELLDELCAS